MAGTVERKGFKNYLICFRYVWSGVIALLGIALNVYTAKIKTKLMVFYTITLIVSMEHRMISRKKSAFLQVFHIYGICFKIKSRSINVIV